MIQSFSHLVSARLLDRAEQLILLVLFGFFLFRLWPDSFGAVGIFTLVYLVSESIVVICILIRHPTDQISMDIRDWAVAAGGTFGTLLIGKGGDPIALQLSFALIAIGMFFHIGAKLCLFRSFGIVAANRGVRTSGPYGWVRHPMYTGYVITHIGYLMLAPSWQNLVLYIFVWIMLILRIQAEERILCLDESYQEFCKSVRYKLIPNIY